MMLEDITHWAGHHAHVLLAGTANGFAWAQSINTGDISPGVIATFCTVVLPIIVSAIVYIIRTLSPVIIKLIQDINAARASTLSGQMTQLNASLADEKRAREAQASLAMIEGKRAEGLNALVGILNAKMDEANAGIAQAVKRADDANVKLHSVNAALARAEARAELAEATARDLQDKLNEAIDQVNKNSEAIHTQAEVKAFGEKVAQAAQDLAHHDAGQDAGRDDIAPPIAPAGH
jgi:hypothetical protein